ncbi:PAS domain-containing protein [Methanosarcina sp. WWM596]|uniref:PAS domain-containing protein n=1 Tax=Methanosarcina sp. WWM596 TaxID=1434103 RepID=UPI0006969AE6|nr:PAS domain-containing protein [Methanosarcina sp. WWM596]
MKQFDINLESLINSSPVVIFLCKSTENWPVELITENIWQFGYTVEDFIFGNIRYLDIIHPEDIERVKSEIAGCLEKGFTELTQEYRIVTASEETRWIEVKVLIRRDGDGKVSHYQGTLCDVTQRKKAEESVQKALKKKNELKNVINSSPVFVFLCKPEEGWPVEFVSENITKLEYTPEDFTSGKIKFEDLIHPEDRERVRAEVAKFSKEGYKDCT